MARKIAILGNWKMNLGPLAAANLAQSLRALGKNSSKIEVGIAPTFLALPAVAESLRASGVLVGAQNVHWDDKGAFTGEISVSMLKELAVDFALVGHSERRHVFSESIELCCKRAIGALEKNLRVVFCIGETLPEREAGKTISVITQQLDPLLDQLTKEQSENLTLAYEPVWAIGTGKVATNAEIAEVFQGLKNYWNQKLSAKKIDLPQILYGGSVDPSNLASILDVELVGGALVGGASLDPQKFNSLTEIALSKC